MNTPSIDELAAKLENLAHQQADINGDPSYDGKRMLTHEDTMYWAARKSILSLSSRVEALEGALKFADEHAKKIEALLEPHIKWDDPKPEGAK